MEKKINSFIYVRVDKGMYGLVQSGIIAHMDLREHLRPFGYDPEPITPRLWRQNKKQNNIYPSGRQLWDKIKEKRIRNSPHTCTARKIRDHKILD